MAIGEWLQDINDRSKICFNRKRKFLIVDVRHIANIIWKDDQYGNSIHYSCRSNMNSLYMWRSKAVLNLLNISSAYGSQFPPLHKVFFFFTCKILMEGKFLARQMKTCKSSTNSLVEKLFPSTITFFLVQ